MRILSPERRSRFIFKEHPAACSRVCRQIDLIKSYLTLDRRCRICQCNRPNFRTSRNRAVCENRKICVETLSTDKLQAHRLKHIIPYVSENLSAEAFYLSTSTGLDLAQGRISDPLWILNTLFRRKRLFDIPIRYFRPPSSGSCRLPNISHHSRPNLYLSSSQQLRCGMVELK